MHYRDQLVLDGRINDVGAYTRTNVPKSYRAGLELETSLQLSRQILFLGNATLSRNTVQEFTEYRDNWDTGLQDPIQHKNTDLAFSPGLTARAEAQWNMLPIEEMHQVAVSISGKYVGKQYLDNTSNENSTLPAYFFTDIRLNYDLNNVFGKQVGLILAVNNVLNARYESNGWVYRYQSEGYDARPDNPYTRLEGDGVYHQAGYFPQAGRSFFGTLRLKF
jgi:iron complex outermembrane receptor protein